MTTTRPHAQRLDELTQEIGTATAQARGGAARQPVSVVGRIDQTAVAFNIFTSLLHSDGIRAALYAVLRQSDYRFLGIFRFKDGKATSCVHVDRENLAITQADEVPDTATYCSFVRGSMKPFATADAASDPRTLGHPARDVVLAYCGIPIMESDGTLIGTLCHYDVVPRDPEQLNLDLLVQVSSALAQPGLVPPYPDLARPPAC
ncbi:GAF domain-containing protein [Pseudorhodoferax sp. Leaf267]|uniref:GAF domain-containing protein n=1 Tax=Pseudorhodoferax sp. Leaf267 TaxID=1736316 RepID=UPI0012E2C4DA|nr:GAF domain-containing protein [Pseudorhodoferax sp. Leaf267]